MKVSIKPQGHPTLDTALLKKLIEDPNIPSLHLELEPGEYYWEGDPITSLKPLFIEGQKDLSARVWLGDGFFIRMGAYLDPFKNPGLPINKGIPQRTSNFKADWAEPGDWVLLWSRDPISNTRAHTGFKYVMPGEIHRVARKSGSDLILSDPTYHNMEREAQGIKIPMLQGCGAANIHFSRKDHKRDSWGRIFDCHGLLGARFERLWSGEEGSGDIFVRYCANTQIDDFSWLRQTEDSNRVYGVVAGPVNGFRYSNSECGESRHIFTTDGISNGKDARHGTVIGAVIENIRGTSGGNSRNESMTLFDTHPEGGDIEFRQCEAAIGYVGGTMYGFGMRAPGASIRRCKVRGQRGTGATYGVAIYGGDITVEDSIFEDVYYGVKVRRGNNATILNNTIMNAAGPAIDLTVGSGHIVGGNREILSKEMKVGNDTVILK